MTTESSKEASAAKKLSRRRVLQAAGVGVTGGALLYGLDKLKLLPDFKPPLPEPPTDKMTYVTQPKSGDKVSLLGFGCMRYPMQPDASGPGGPEIDEAAAFRLVDYALAHGVNYFDTAYVYHQGMSEVMTGKALKRHPRERFFLATKMPGRMNPDRAKAKEIFETQLARCQVEYVDYYLLHNLQSAAHYKKVYEDQGVLDYLLEEKRQGRIRNLGWSFHGDQEMLEYVLSRPVDWDFAQIQLNYHDLMHQLVLPPGLRRSLVNEPAPAKWTYDKMQASGLPLVVMEPLLGGRLARLNKKTLAVLQTHNPQASGASWAFRYAAGLPNVFTVLSGMTYMEHLQDNLRTLAPFTPLSEPETDVLGQALDLFLTQSNIRCTTCGYCMPCPYGVDIPAVFSHFNRCLDDEQVPKGARDPEYEKARRAFLVAYEREVPELRQAARCTGCKKCLEHCPQRIAIPDEMARLGKMVEDLRVRQG